MKTENPQRAIKIEKITLNIGVGQAGDKLEKAKKLLNQVTNKKPILTKTQKRIPTWGLRPNLPIGTKVTLRDYEATLLLQRLFTAIDNQISEKKFDKFGNFAFGIQEYIDIPDVSYDIDIGIIGLEVAVTLKRAGFRIKKRRIKPSKIKQSHLITKREAIDFIKHNFKVKIAEEA